MQYIIAFVILLAAGMLQAGCSMFYDDKVSLYEGMPIWTYSYSYTVNGQYVSYDYWHVLRSSDYFFFSWNPSWLYDFLPSLDAQGIYLYLSEYGSPHKAAIHFWSEDGPLREGVEYPIDQAFAIYDAWTYSRYDEFDHGEHGIGVNMLSGSFRLDYSDNDSMFIKEVLDVYFDFEEVVTSVPDDINYNGPSVGDIIRVSGGHFSQNLYFLDPDNLDDISRMPNRAYPFDISTLKTIIIPE